MNKRLKQVLCFILMTSILLFGTSCTMLYDYFLLKNTQNNDKPTSAYEVTQPTLNNTVNEIKNHTSPYYKKAELKHGYNSLQTEAQKALYEGMENQIYTVREHKDNDSRYPLAKITLYGYQLEIIDIYTVLEAYSCDYPQVFWLSNWFSYELDTAESYVQLYSNFSPDEIEKCTGELDEKLNNVIGSVPADLTEFDRELFLHDFLVDNCTYSSDQELKNDDKYAYNIYGAMVKQNAVCEGYAQAMQYLLRCVGIESMIVNGISDDELHAWNAVKIENEWYHLDVTWNDNEEFPIYDYFNINTETLLLDHTITKDFTEITDEEFFDEKALGSFMVNLNVPKCTATEYNYYNKKATILFGFDEQSNAAMTSALYKSAEVQSEVFYMKVDEGLDFDYAVNQLFNEDPYYFFSYIDTVNWQLPSVRLGDTFRYVKNEEQRLINVLMVYEQR